LFLYYFLSIVHLVVWLTKPENGVEKYKTNDKTRFLSILKEQQN
jgi:hypothetical protein